MLFETQNPNTETLSFIQNSNYGSNVEKNLAILFCQAPGPSGICFNSHYVEIVICKRCFIWTQNKNTILVSTLLFPVNHETK